MNIIHFQLCFSILTLTAHYLPAVSPVSPLRQQYETVPVNTKFEKKPITVLLYGSARNDLMPFIDRNLMQLMQIGSNSNITFLVHLDIFGPGRKQLTQRFIVYKNKLVQVGENMRMDSGDPATFIDAGTWAFKNFPADMTIIDLWNHGTGDLEPSRGRAINSSELYTFNPTTKLIELNRSIGFLDYLDENSKNPENELRGICFDESTGHYLSNRQVGHALETISKNCLGGKPIDILCCDACLMQGIGFAYSIKSYRKPALANILIGSQEVVLATGYPYIQMFAKMAQKPMSGEQFATHTVQAFADAYSQITHDYTQSAIKLELLDSLYESIDAISLTLMTALRKQKNSSVKTFITKSGARNACTHFEEPSYKDMHHLFSNMLENISLVTLHDPNETAQIKHELRQELTKACGCIKQATIANAAGRNLKNATGISIYLPEPNKAIHPSFPHTDFAKNIKWLDMLKVYINS